jgi:ubiquinone/menaquinone biosynthesis C-methylase UbiE
VNDQEADALRLQETVGHETESSRSPQAFDELAPTYDVSFTETALGRCLRSMVWQRLDEALAGCRRVLELGCGTGEDAIHLARSGLEVTATDPSPPMLRIAAEKAERAACAQRIRFCCVSVDRLGTELAGETFDGVFSNFGAINCVSRLDEAVGALASLLAPGAPLVWVVMGRNVPWEWLWFLARGERQKAFRRRRDGAVWRGVPISYPTPATLARTLSPHFAPVRRRALGLVLPPSYASGWLERSPRTLSMLTALERVAQRWQPLAALADHYIFEARRLPPRPA